MRYKDLIDKIQGFYTDGKAFTQEGEIDESIFDYVNQLFKIGCHKT